MLIGIKHNPLVKRYMISLLLGVEINTISQMLANNSERKWTLLSGRS
jgi:hypothetical protein